MFHAKIYGPLAKGMVIVQLYCWKFSHKETLQHTFVMQYDIILTYSMFTFSAFTASKDQFTSY